LCFDSLFEVELLAILFPSILKLLINRWLNFPVPLDRAVGGR
jgi:hypothetical protein